MSCITFYSDDSVKLKGITKQAIILLPLHLLLLKTTSTVTLKKVKQNTSTAPPQYHGKARVPSQRRGSYTEDEMYSLTLPSPPFPPPSLLPIASGPVRSVHQRSQPFTQPLRFNSSLARHLPGDSGGDNASC